MSLHLPYFLYREIYKTAPQEQNQNMASLILQCGEEPIDYTQLVRNFTDLDWFSQPFYKYSAFSGFHRGADNSLRWIFPDYETFTGYRVNPDDLLDFSDENVNVDDIIWQNRGPLAFAVIGLIFAALLTIFGIGWCVMKCCCCCMRNSNTRDGRDGRDGDKLLEGSEEERKEKCIRIGCGVTLAVLIILSLASLISLFGMNNQLRDGINGVPNDVDNSFHDVKLYLENTKGQFDDIFIGSYGNLTVALECVLGNAPDFLKSDASSTITKFQQLEKVSTTEQQRLDAVGKGLSLSVERLLEFCKTHPCPNQNDITKNLTGIASDLGKVQTLTETIQQYARNFMSALQETKEYPPTKEQLKQAIQMQGQGLKDVGVDLMNTLDTVLSDVETARHNLVEVEDEFKKVNPHLHSVMLVICLFLLAISVVLFFGAVLSFFTRPKAVTKTRSITLNCGICTIFLFGGILWIFTMACFLLAGVLTQVLPGALRSLENENSTELIIQHHGHGRFKLNDDYKLPSYGSIATNCKEGNSAYKTFNLSQIYKLDNILDLVNQFNVSTQFLATRQAGALNQISLEIASLTTELALSQNRASLLSDDLEQTLEAFRTLANSNDADSLQASLAALEEIRLNELRNIKTGLANLRNQLSVLSPELSPKEISAWFEKFLNYINEYAKFVYHEMSENAGQCEPMYNALNSSINIFSYKIGSPIAGFWFSLNTVMLLFFPIVITAIVLQRL